MSPEGSWPSGTPGGGGTGGPSGWGAQAGQQGPAGGQGSERGQPPGAPGPPPPGRPYYYAPPPSRPSSNGWKWALGICGVLLALVMVVVGLFVFGIFNFANDVRKDVDEFNREFDREWERDSRENAQIVIPDVSSLTVDEARQKLEAAGFQVDVFEFPDRSVPEGRVIETNPSPGQTWPRGWDVTIRVSTGPPLR